MRSILISTVVLFLIAASAPAGEAARDLRHVVVDVAEVRSGPSDAEGFYPTNRLPRGTPVEVTGERPNGWLEIRPPQGSFSYVNPRVLSQPDAGQATYVWIKEGSSVPVLIGSEVVNRRPTVVGVTLQRGALVFNKGLKGAGDPEGLLMQIVPPDRERRFIRADAVSGPSPMSGATAPSGGTAHLTLTPGGGPPPSSAPSANPPSTTPQAKCEQAYQAERAGLIQKAIELYAQASADCISSNPILSDRAYKRAQYLRSGYRTGAPATGGVVATPVSRVSGAVSVGPPATPGAVPQVPAPIEPAGGAFTAVAPAGPVPRVANALWLGYRGVLRRSGWSVDGVQTYVLDDPITLAPLVEVKPLRGLNLDAHLTRTVQVWGYTWYRGDLRRNFMNGWVMTPEP